MPAPPLPSYSAVTLATLRQSLLDRTNSARFWGNPAELNTYIKSALRSWQATARYWRLPVGFSTHGGNFFYDLATEVPQLAYTVTDSDVLSHIEYHLIEPQSGIPSNPTWQGTAMFPQDAYTDAISRRRDRFLLESGAVVGHFTTPVVTAGVNRVTLPSSLIDIRRVSWVDANGKQSVVFRDDEFAANAYFPEWLNTPGTPVCYSVIATQPFTLQLIPAPADIGNLDLLAIDQGAPLNPAVGVVLGIPDNYASAITWGAMADLLSQDGPGRDLERAAYCDQRYISYVQMSRDYPTVINASINGVSAQLDSVANFDAFSVGWNNTPYAAPTVLGLASQTMLATSSVPDPATPFSISLDAVVNAPIPPDDITPINVSADIADVLVDYAQFLAVFKSGGKEFADAEALRERFEQKAGLFRQQSGARAPYWLPMAKSNQLELVARKMFR